jgi:RNA ligase (TIGR02306 family)
MGSEMTRKLASVRRIVEIKQIDGADSICLYRVDGWWVVDSIGKYGVGELVIYAEPDSWVPYELAPFLCRGKEPREFNGVKGERLRTIKLRGQISQGLVLPLDPSEDMAFDGQDMTERYGIQKWEKPIPAQLQGQMRGNFPSWIRKTDQERVQNLDGEIYWDDEYEITVKLDGSSMTIWNHDGEVGVCSRNVDLKMDQEGNSFVNMAKKILGRIELLEEIAIQGELIGPSIQGNREGLAEHEFYVFDIYDIAAQAYWSPLSVQAYCETAGLNHVPVIDSACKLIDKGICSIESALAFAEGKSLNNPVREGLVFKRTDGEFSFKAISNVFLLGEK